MDLTILYKYAYWGAIHEIKTLTYLYNTCIEVDDKDAAEEYKIRIEKTKSDFDTIIYALGLNYDDTYELLNWEIKRGI